MQEVLNNFSAGLLALYNAMVSELPLWVQSFLNFFILVVIIVLYSVLVWKFYRFISKKNPLGLNLNKYNTVEHSFFSKLLAALLYFVEYVLILPFLVFVIFVVFTFFLILLSQTETVSHILIISAVVIATIRMTSYYKEDVSQEVAKMLPYTLLAVSILNPTSFLQSHYIEKTITHFSQIPSLITDIKLYLFFIILLEVILLIFDYTFSLLGLESETPEKSEKEAKESN
ncbi:hypothetical protein K9L16_03510 [Candidatus Pacearchaeota archaeon]|nr:hypothetical protein [Candidatus Pacearchaeota archaeon]